MSRSVLVTGGNRGIGLAIALAFAEAGDKVAITSRSGEVPEALAKYDVLAVRCDITDSAQVDAALTEVEAAHGGAIEVLVANAGVTSDTLLLRMSEEAFTSVVDTNLTGTFRVVKRASKLMMRARKGRIVLISSVVGLSGSRARPTTPRQGRPGRLRPFAGARAGPAQHHRQRGRPRLRGHRHDRGAHRRAPRGDRQPACPWAVTRRPPRSLPPCGSSVRTRPRTSPEPSFPWTADWAWVTES